MESTSKQPIRRSVTQKDIAERAGVSTAVVSYVINDGPLPVADDTRERVLAAIKELGYRPNKYARGLRAKADRAERQIGIVMGGEAVLLRPYYADILFGIYDEAYRQGQHIRFLHLFDELHDPRLFNEHIHPEEISALILLAPDTSSANPQNQELLMQMLKRIDNVVCLDQAIANVPSVMVDRLAMARTAVTHLIRLGHQRIAFVGSIAEQPSRFEGYRQTLLEHGLAYDDRLVIQAPHNLPEESYDNAHKLSNLKPRPTAVFAACDENAIGVIKGLSERGVRVPEDIAMVSIDDLELARFMRPALTTVRIPRRQMGVHALRMLALHETYPDTQPGSMILPTELIIRESCGAQR